jgi:DNA-binding CsgD family transcriptional regulator
MGARRPRLGMAGRAPMRSPGRPPVARREGRQRFWKAIAHGLSSEDAAVVCGVAPAVGARWFRQGGGMPSTSLAPLSGRYLSFTEREEITVLTAQGCGVREIARRVGRSASTISREVRRNAATRGGLLEYRATTAQWHADRRAKRPKVAKLAGNDTLRAYVQDRLAGRVTAPDGTAVPGPEVRSDRTPSRAPQRTGDGPGRGVQNRSPTGSGSTSPMMGPWGSPMRRSTRPCRSKAAARCAVS